jgi:hypothetical protein
MEEMIGVIIGLAGGLVVIELGSRVIKRRFKNKPNKPL